MKLSFSRRVDLFVCVCVCCSGGEPAGGAHAQRAAGHGHAAAAADRGTAADAGGKGDKRVSSSLRVGGETSLPSV